MSDSKEILEAIEIFVKGHSVGRSRTHPCEHQQFAENLWVMRDSPRKNPRDYRKEEWIVLDCDPAFVDQAARANTRGRFFVCQFMRKDESDKKLRQAFKKLRYRLIATEPFFVHHLLRIARTQSPAEVVQVKTMELAKQLGKASGSRPIPEACFKTDGPFRQYVAILDGQVVGWVRSVPIENSSWCSSMQVLPKFRRQGIGRALLAKMLRDDRRLELNRSVLLASHSGALLYPQVGYEQIGLLYIYAPPNYWAN